MRGDRSAPCARCTLPAQPGECGWCGHDPADPAASADLTERRGRLLAMRSDRRLRRLWLTEIGASPFGSCPACGQWGRFGQCEHCGFDQTDTVAVDALGAHHAHRRTARSDRRGEQLLGPKGTCDRCWLRPVGTVGVWCGHDNPDDAARAELLERRWAVWDERRRSLGDRDARRARREALGKQPAFMACPSCSQRSRWGMCEWCDLDATDTVAVAANTAARAVRLSGAALVGRICAPGSPRRAAARHHRAWPSMTCRRARSPRSALRGGS